MYEIDIKTWALLYFNTLKSKLSMYCLIFIFEKFQTYMKFSAMPTLNNNTYYSVSFK